MPNGIRGEVLCVLADGSPVLLISSDLQVQKGELIDVGEVGDQKIAQRPYVSIWDSGKLCTQPLARVKERLLRRLLGCHGNQGRVKKPAVREKRERPC